MARKAVVIGSALSLLAFVLAAPLAAAPRDQAAGTVHVSQVDISSYPRVTLYVSVLDADGRAVEGLQRSDFQITEGGEVVQIEDLSGLGQQRPVDVVFVFDTSGSMGGQVQGVRQTCVEFAETLERQGRDYRLGLVTFWDDVRGVYRSDGSLTGDVAEFRAWLEEINPQGGQGGDEPENPYGAIKRAAAMSFRPDAQRVLILITDATPHHYGDPPDSGVTFDDPDLDLEPILEVLRERSITAYVVAIGYGEYNSLAGQTGGGLYSIGGDFTAIIGQLAEAIGSQYRVVYRTPRPDFDGSTRQVQVRVRGTAAMAAYTSPAERLPGIAGGFFAVLRTPLDISTDPAVVGTNLFLAVLVALLFGLTSTILNDTLTANRDAFDRSFVGRALAGFKKVGQVLVRPLGSVSLRGRRVWSYVQVALVLVLTALIGCYLDPSFRPFSWAGVGLFFSMLCSIGLVNLVYEGSQVLAARRFRLDAALKLNPAGILVALGCVLFSRLVGFLPGYLYGIPGGYALGSAVELSRRREAAIGGVGLGAAALLALLAWGLTIPSALLLQAPGAGFVGGLIAGLQSLLLTIFFVGLEVVFLEMFPLGPTNGTALFNWSKVVWGLAFGLAGFMAFHTLFTPESAYLDAVRNRSLQLLLGVLAFYSALTVGLWLFLEVRRPAARVCPSCGQEADPWQRFCVYCGVALPELAPRKVGRQGLVMVVVLGLFWLAIGVAVVLAAAGVG